MIERVVLSGRSFLLLMGGKVVLNGWRYALEGGEIWCCETIGMG